MPDVSELTLAFIDRRPNAAARILAANRGSESGAFIAAIPTHHACKILTNLNTHVASMVLRQADVAAAAAIVQNLEFSQAVALLRQIQPSARKALLKDVPRILRIKLERSLSFAANTVGALMTTNIRVLSVSDTCETALQLIRHDAGSRCDAIFIQDNKKAYRGTVRLLSLLQRPEHTPLIDLVDASTTTLSAHASVQQIAKLPDWDEFTTLPVIARKGDVIGGLNRRAVQTGSSLTEPATNAAPGSMLRELSHSMTHCASGLLELLVPARRHSELPDEH